MSSKSCTVAVAWPVFRYVLKSTVPFPHSLEVTSPQRPEPPGGRFTSDC